jgi:hypothetical protein
MSGDVYLVWSNEHRAWWRPNAQGYTVHHEAAGRYTREEALQHSRGRDQYSGQPLPEMPIREADLNEILCPMHWTTELQRVTGGD